MASASAAISSAVSVAVVRLSPRYSRALLPTNPRAHMATSRQRSPRFRGSRWRWRQRTGSITSAAMVKRSMLMLAKGQVARAALPAT